MLGVDLKSFQDADWLTRDHPFKTLKLRTLSTDRGIAIGDQPETVLRIMGAPTWKGGSQFVAGEKVWSYHRIVGTKDDGMEYISLFRFRNGRITAIELHTDSLPG